MAYAVLALAVAGLWTWSMRRSLRQWRCRRRAQRLNVLFAATRPQPAQAEPKPARSGD